MSQSPSATLGPYQIIREIARSNDIVYEAYDPVMNRRVAVKELTAPRAVSDQQKTERLKRFHREARAAGSLVHPNIVTVYQVGADGERHYIAMEFLSGHNLRQELDAKGSLDPVNAVRIALEVLDGLAFAHEKGVVHRDIKPDNIQLLDDGQIKITDFGIARLMFEENITIDGQVFGTPSYMSPEQINGKEIDARSDVFSLGIVLFEIISGEKPFTGDSVVSISYAIMNHRPSQPRQCNWALWQVLEQALDKTPSMRFSSAEAMHIALKHALEQMLSGDAVLNAPPVVTPPPLPNAQAYTPYGGAVPYQVAPPQQQPSQPPGYAPIYYPPPPRRSAINPAVSQAITKTIAILIGLGLLIVLLIVGLQALLDVAGDQQSLSPPPAQAAPAELPPTSEQDAIATERLGREAEARGDYESAIAYYSDAVRFDFDNPAYHESLAAAYSKLAEQTPEVEAQSTYWKNAGYAWVSAAERTSDEGRQHELLIAGATALYNAAVVWASAGQYTEARQALYDAVAFAPRGTAVRQQALSFQRELESF